MTYADQWSEAAAFLRRHAAQFDDLARTAPTRETEIDTLLSELDGHLGLAVHRGEGGREEWIKEAATLITRIRAVLAGRELSK